MIGVLLTVFDLVSLYCGYIAREKKKSFSFGEVLTDDLIEHVRFALKELKHRAVK